MCQIKADVLNKTIICIETEEPSLLGAAILAGKAAGIYKDLISASEQMVKIKERIEPVAGNVKMNEKPYELYVKIYESLADVFPKQNE